VEVVVVVGKKEEEVNVDGPLAVIVSMTVTLCTIVETSVLVVVNVIVVNGPVGTELLTTAAGPARHKAQKAFVHKSLS
jgi:hypothetical protein